MKVATLLYQNNTISNEINNENLLYENAQLVICFGLGEIITDENLFATLKSKFPNATLCLSSTAGEIFDVEVFENSVSIVAISFSTAHIETSLVNIKEVDSSFEAGKKLVAQLPKEQLKLIFVLSDGGKVNGSELVKGLNLNAPQGVLITGGLAGDSAKFEQTFVGLNQVPQTGNIVAIGFYGNNLTLSHGSIGGWDCFGLEREVTKAKSNVLFEIDHKNALNLYKTYLGKYADELPSSALLFPLSLTLSDAQKPIVRTILSIDEKEQSLTFAGDIPVGSKVKFMKANFDRLIDAASDAASGCLTMNNSVPKLAFLISCVGRKLVLGNRISEEVEAVAEIFGTKTALTGFYSYGEISPIRAFSNCELHNQTMTITCIDEIE